MEFLEEIFQGRALTYADFVQAFEEDGRLRLVMAEDEAARDLRVAEDSRELELLREEVSSLRGLYEDAKKEAAVDLAILQAGGRNVRAIKALLDLSEVQLLADGSLQGFSLQELKEKDGYLFEDEEPVRRGPGFERARFSNRAKWQQDFEEAVWVR